jgi:hypothetical protein
VECIRRGANGWRMEAGGEDGDAHDRGRRSLTQGGEAAMQ